MRLVVDSNVTSWRSSHRPTNEFQRRLVFATSMKKNRKTLERQREAYRGVVLIARTFATEVRGKAWCHGQEIAAVAGVSESSVMALMREHVDNSIVVETAENSPPYPNAQRYAESLLGHTNDLTTKQLAMLRAHQRAPALALTGESLAEIADCTRWSLARAQYTALGRLLGESMLFEPLPSTKSSPMWIRMVAHTDNPGEGDQAIWTLRPELACALSQVC